VTTNTHSTQEWNSRVGENSKTLIFAHAVMIRYGHFMQQASNMAGNPEKSQPDGSQKPTDPSIAAVRRIDVTGFEPAAVFVSVELTPGGMSTVE
jgi:hypothetical protein